MPSAATGLSRSLKLSWTSLIEGPRTIHAVPEVNFLDREGKSTISDVKSVNATVSNERREVRVPRVMTRDHSSTVGFILLQKWDGVVVEADQDTFTAKLLDARGNAAPQNATFARAELSNDEQELIEPGAPFVWTVGYKQRGGTRERSSVMYFRRLPTWSASELEAAETRAQTLRKTIGWE
jgi:hypothetical protein